VKILHVIEELAGLKGPIVLAAGTFDGVHLGHQALIRRALQEKIALLREMGVPVLMMLEFTRELSEVPAMAFIDSLTEAANPLRAICVGSQWFFGKGGEGNVLLLREFGTEKNFEVIQIAPVEVSGSPISSTRIRRAIASGNLSEASDCLGRPFLLSGEVVTGAGLGSKIGFPTANLDVSGMQLPPNGVYAVKVRRKENLLMGVCNIGLRPTVDTVATTPVVEVHLFDVSADLVGENLSLEFVKFLRPEKKFSGLEELKEQIASDCRGAKAIFSS
jgi:riboflavin kinase / FMN adenylyltransferase